MKILEGKIALVTGSQKGIGRATVEKFAAHGATVWAHARTESEEFSTAMDSLAQKESVTVLPIYFDLLDYDAVKNGIQKIASHKKGLDILVNNAGAVGVNQSFVMTPIQKIREIFDINFFAQTNLTQLATRLMLRTKQGAIINISSIAAIDGTPGQYEYVASKAALIGATKKLALELGSYGIRVNAIAPGIIETQMAQQITPELVEQTLSNVILNRLGNPDEVADAIVFLASPMASYITGQIIRVDGGM